MFRLYNTINDVVFAETPAESKFHYIRSIVVSQ